MRAVGDPDVIPLATSAHVSASFRHICLQVLEDTQICYSDRYYTTSPAVLLTSLFIIHEFVGDLIPDPHRIFLSADTVANKERGALRYLIELLNTLTASTALADHRTKFKKGYLFTVLRLWDPASDHAKDASYVLEDTSTSLLDVRSAIGTYSSHFLCFPRKPCGPDNNDFLVPGFTRVQFPVCACFVITVSKSQGKSVRRIIGLDLLDMCFSQGYLYAALARTTHLSNMLIRSLRVDNATCDVVYQKLFSKIVEELD